MKKYPEIYLTRLDLIQIRELYETSGIPQHAMKRPFLKVEAAVRKNMAERRCEAWRVDAKPWLIGWAYDDTMRNLKPQHDMQRSENYLQGSKS